MDVGFLVNRKDPGSSSTSYLSYHSVNPFGTVRDTLDIAVFDGVATYYARGGECRGLLCFYHHDGDVLICNPTTKERKIVPPSKVSNPDLHGDCYFGYGFGYDESSQDFKILRFFKRKGKNRFEFNPDLPMRAEIYSFKKNSWKRIRCRKDLSCVAFLSDNRVGALVNGNLYWAASFSDDVYDGVDNALLSFNLATEDFSIFPLPYPTVGIDNQFPRLLQDIFDFDGEVGAFVYEIPDIPDEPDSQERPRKPEEEVGTQIWVWKPEEGSWEMKFKFMFANVLKPLALKYGRIFLQVRIGYKLVQLRVYNMNTDKFVNLDVYANTGMLAFFPYTWSTFALPKDAVDAR